MSLAQQAGLPFDQQQLAALTQMAAGQTGAQQFLSMLGG
jgi:hypothetical protein